MPFPDADCIGDGDLGAGMAGAKRINQASQTTEEMSAQLDLWTLLGETRVVTDASGAALVPWQAESRSADTPGRVEAQRTGRGSALAALDLGKSMTPYPKQGTVKGKTKLTIAKARWGNRSVVVRRD